MTWRQRRARRSRTDRQEFWKTGLGYLTQAVLLVGAIAGLLGALGTFNGKSTSDTRAATGAPAAPRLELVDVAVTGGTPARCLKDRSIPQTLDLSVRNAGELPAIVRRIAFRVLATGHLETSGKGGGLEPSHDYDIAFPPDPRVSQSITYRVTQAVEAKAVDRFTVRLDEHEPFRQLGTELYRLQVLLYHDTARTPLDAGTILVALPFVPDKYYFKSGVPPALRSFYRGAEARLLESNERILRKMVAYPGARAPTLTLALVNEPLSDHEPNPCVPGGAQQPQAPEEGRAGEEGQG
jgi:hypothetical protein